MLFNLGLTANIAAAHESDSAAANSAAQRSSPVHRSSRSIAFATLPSLGLDDLYNCYRGVPQGKAPPTDRPAMSGSSVDSLPMSDANHSTVGPDLARPRIGRAQTHSVRKQSSRAKTSYQLAHPAGHARHRRLKLRPKLLLQVQRVSPTSRPLPVLDVLPSSVFFPRLARKFPAIFRGKKGLGPNDLIVVASDLYEPAGGPETADRPSTSDDESGEHREVIATICQLLKESELSQGKTEICLHDGPVWEATPLPNGSYEFVAHTEQGIQILRWVLRSGRNRRVSAPPGSALTEDGRRFTFSVINPTTRRHPVLASMTRNHLEVFHEYSMPSSAASTASPTSGMSVVSDLSEADTALDRKAIPVDESLRTLITVTSIWVAMREGWSHNFRYDDSALALNPKAICASRHHLPVTPKNENEPFPRAQAFDADGSRNGSKPRRPTSSTLPPSLSAPNSPVAYGRLTKRSNSTGAAFIERSNRRASGLDNGINRHSTLCSPRGVSQSRIPESDPAPGAAPAAPAAPGAPVANGQTRSQRKKTDPSDRTHPGAHSETSRSVLGHAAESEPAKGKCRRRLSHVFDFLVRRNSHRH